MTATSCQLTCMHAVCSVSDFRGSVTVRVAHFGCTRRGCPCEPERGADRGRHYHGSRSDTEQDAGYRTILGRPDHDGYVLPFCQSPARYADSRRVSQLKKKTSLQHRRGVGTDDLVYLSAGRYWTFLLSSEALEARYAPEGAEGARGRERIGSK